MDHFWTMLFCTVHLCLGYIAGRGRCSTDADLIGAARALKPSVNRFERTYGTIESELDQLPVALRAAVEELRQSVSVLSSELSKEKQQTRKPGMAAEQPAGCVESNLSCVVRREATSPNVAAEQRNSERVGHNVPEFMATFEDDFRSLGHFEQVQCHDLSATGVSFFLDRPLPDGDTLLITLGQQTGGIIMAAKVVYSRPIIVRGTDQYRIGCKFERRLDTSEAALLEPSLNSARELYAITAPKVHA